MFNNATKPKILSPMGASIKRTTMDPNTLNPYFRDSQKGILFCGTSPQHLQVNSTDLNGQTALHLAALRGDEASEAQLRSGGFVLHCLVLFRGQWVEAGLCSIGR